MGLKKSDKNYQMEVNHLLKVLIKTYQPEKIIAFGSTASGEVSENSDIDLLLIKKTKKSFWKRVREVLRLYDGFRSFDVSVLTPAEIEQAEKKGWYFITEEIIKQGRVLYEQS